MFAEQRQQEILNLLQLSGSVKVKELSSRFSVTEDCIRKDLTLLERRELLKRTYGGAVLPRRNVHHHEVKNRKNSDVDSKKQIAQKAFELIAPGSTIFLDISTSNIELARLIIDSRMHLTVVSNMLDVAHLFAASRDARFICTGGMYNSTYDGFDGNFCMEAIAKFKFDLSFIGNVGIDVLSNKIYTYEHDDGLTKAAVIHASRQPYIVSQEKKFSEDGNYCFCTLDDIAGIILDVPPVPAVQKMLRKSNVKIIV